MSTIAIAGATQASQTISGAAATQARPSLKDLGQALESGDVARAQTVFTAMKGIRGVSLQGGDGLTTVTATQAGPTLKDLAKALADGNIRLAQQIFEKLKHHKHTEGASAQQHTGGPGELDNQKLTTLPAQGLQYEGGVSGGGLTGSGTSGDGGSLNITI